VFCSPEAEEGLNEWLKVSLRDKQPKYVISSSLCADRDSARFAWPLERRSHGDACTTCFKFLANVCPRLGSRGQAEPDRHGSIACRARRCVARIGGRDDHGAAVLDCALSVVALVHDANFGVIFDVVSDKADSSAMGVPLGYSAQV